REIAAGNYGAGPAKRRDDEIGELAEALDGVSAEIERSEKVKNDFISSVSHELRTPLTAISGWAETLAADVTDPDSLEAKGLETIRKESGRLGGIVEELLDFSKLGAGHEVLNRTAFDLNAELAETIFMMEQRLAQDGVHVVYTDATGDAPVWGDRQRIRQVFVNLLDNARGFSKPGDAVDVTIEESGRTGFVAVRVRDHGPGIAPEDLPHVKEKFYKGKNSRQGSGIGLALSDEIVALHGGTLTIQSPPGEGVTATVELPLYER
ncbi:MAG: HAMP domain-containing histidine kinase, partial [Oscillospiraceae bacterium]|nr:HAMP domain-containing histidine kinase [Oscillospiraceae bacterium]